MQQLFVLNRLQDLLGLPRTTNSSYPVNADPLHGDNILVEDIWEATKILTLDQSRRGTAQISEIYHPIVKGQDVYALPFNCCKLLDVEYISSRNPQIQLEHVYYDQMVLNQFNSYHGIPSSYCLTEASARLVLRTDTTTSAGMVELYEQDGIPFTTTTNGTQIEQGDLIFNKTTKAEGEVHMMKSFSPEFSYDVNEGQTVFVSTANIPYNPQDGTSHNQCTGNQIRITQGPQGAELFNTGTVNNISVGMIIYDEKQESWLVITGKVEGEGNTSASSILLETDGIVRGKAHSIEELLTGVGDNETQQNAIVGTDGNTYYLGLALGKSQFKVGSPDIIDLMSSNILISDANEGMAGGIDRLVKTETGLSGKMAIHSNGENITTNLDISSYVGLQATTTASGIYTGYYFFMTDNEGNEHTGYLAPTEMPPVWSTETTLSDAVGYNLYSDIYLTYPANNAPTASIEIASYSIYRSPFIKGDSYQIEQRLPTLDSVTVFPVPDITDVQGTESLRFIYYAFPSKPQHIRSPIGLPEAYSDAVIAKSFEIAKRRETGGTEPYDMSLHRTTSGRRHLPETPTRKRSLQPGLYVNVPYP